MPFQSGYRSFLLVSKQLGCHFANLDLLERVQSALEYNLVNNNLKIGDHCAYNYRQCAFY